MWERSRFQFSEINHVANNLEVAKVVDKLSELMVYFVTKRTVFILLGL